jgi:hypothetical protein
MSKFHNHISVGIPKILYSSNLGIVLWLKLISKRSDLQKFVKLIFDIMFSSYKILHPKYMNVLTCPIAVLCIAVLLQTGSCHLNVIILDFIGGISIPNFCSIICGGIIRSARKGYHSSKVKCHVGKFIYFEQDSNPVRHKSSRPLKITPLPHDYIKHKIVKEI